MGRFLPLFFVLLLLLGAAVPAAGDSLDVQSLPPVGLRLNGEAISGEVPGVILGGRTLAPLRLLAEALGAQVEWRPDHRQVQITRGETDILLTLDEDTAQVNGAPQPLPDGVPATVVTSGGQGYTMVPLRFFSEALGCRVSWEQGSYTACVLASDYIGPLLDGLDAPNAPERFLVAVDAGHGGAAIGACYEETAEKDLDLAMAQKLRDILEGLGYNVLMTRDSDVDVSLSQRAQMANSAKADAFVSIHCNAAEKSRDFQGLYVYHYPGSTQGAALAQTIQTPACAFTGAVDRGIDAANFAVVRETEMPAVLVEAGFMTCPEELARLREEDYQARVARGIAQGIVRYLNGKS